MSEIVEVNESNVEEAARIHSISWQESHKTFCKSDFVALHTPERQKNYILDKMATGSKFFMLVQKTGVGIVSVTKNLIEDLYVLPVMQNKGFGSELLRFACAKCDGKPTLWILENNVNAARLYSRLGFRATGKRNFIAENLDEIEFERDCELWDAYNRDFEKVAGVTLVRGDKIPSGLFHLVCDIIVRHSDGEYLLMQRDFYKHFGGMWEATAGGSALKGESALECARRELKEETGIESGNLLEIGRVVREENQSLYVEYLCETDSDKSAIRLQKGETVAFKWVSAKELREMKKAELVTQRIQQFIDELK